jgi:hypothetical protein
MLSVIIATLDSEPALARTLRELFPGVMAGVLREVLVADGGSTDGTMRVADVAGCNFMVVEGLLGGRLRAAAAQARAPWILFLRPGTILEAPWTEDVSRFVAQAPDRAAAAVFRRSAPAAPAPWQIWSRFTAAIGGRQRPDQGLLISKQFYETIGGHSEDAADPEGELLHRIGKRRLVTLASGAVAPG